MKTTKHRPTLNHLFAISLLAALGTGAAAMATAANAGDEPRQVTVKYDDLDLSHAAGTAQLYGRIRRAWQAISRQTAPE